MLRISDPVPKICFSCATIFDSSDNKVFQCPICGKETPADLYESILSDAREAVRYGWIYRNAYEGLLDEHEKINVHFYIADCVEIINFIALAIASGVIGGFSYDIVKKAIQKIRNAVLHRDNKQEKKDIFELINDEDEMKKFMLYIHTFYSCFDSLDADVREAIYEEMIVDKLSPTLEKFIVSQNPEIDIDHIKEISPFSEEDIFRTMLEVNKKIENRKNLDKTTFKSFWTDVDN